MDVKYFQTRQSFGESQQLLLAAGVILRIAFAEMASTNALLEKKVFTDSQCKKMEKCFRDLMSYMGISAQAFRNKCIDLDNEQSKQI